MKEKFTPLQFLPGVDKDNTALNTQFFTDADKIRFYDGQPQKIGGWDSIIFNNENIILGACRTIYSQRVVDRIWTVFGTNTSLFALSGTYLVNITPLVTGTTAIANSLSTHYSTLPNNPITTINGSSTVTISHPAHSLEAGDVITISGVPGAVNGIPAANFNATQFVRAVTTNSYTIIVGTAATSSGTGGGNAVIEADAIITVTQAAHGFANGSRVKIGGATATGGIPAAEINIEHLIRNVTVNTYDFVTITRATSSVTAAGGAATTVRGEIPAGPINAFYGQGYGMGLYGAGLYGVAKQSLIQLVLPRIWSFGRFGNNLLANPGGQTGVYQWTGTDVVAPTVLTNAPTAVNLIFVSDEIVVTLGASGVPNRVKWSDQGNSAIWTGTITNQAGEDDIEGANQFIGQVNVRGINLLFTSNQVYTMQYIGPPLIWQIKQVDSAQGLIAQNAVVVVNGIAYWQGTEDFYMYNGGVATPIPSNNQAQVNYLRKYVFNNINVTQQSKCFAWFNPLYNEVWFHYPTASSNECDALARYHILEQHWVPDTMDRLAAEAPHILEIYPKLISSTNLVYRHEKGVNDVDSPLPFSLTGPVLQAGNNQTILKGIIPDSDQIGDIQLQVAVRPYPQSTQILYASPTATNSPTPIDMTVSPNTPKLDYQISGRIWQHKWSQNELDGDWRMGLWMDKLEEGTPR